MGCLTKKTSRLETNSRMTKPLSSTLSALKDYTALAVAGDLYRTLRAPLALFVPTATIFSLLVSYLQTVLRYTIRCGNLILSTQLPLR